MPRSRVRGVVHVCRFTAGLDDLTQRKQRDVAEVLRVLHRERRFSVFEATANMVIARTMVRLREEQLIEITPAAFPWSTVRLTGEGRRLIGEESPDAE